MYRFVKMLKILGPSFLGIYTVKPIFQIQQTNKNSINIEVKADKIIQLVIDKQSSNEQNKQSSEQKDKVEQNSNIKVQQNNESKNEKINQNQDLNKQNSVNDLNLNQNKVVEIVRKQAFIPQNSSEFIINYLQMQGFIVIKHHHIKNIKLINQIGDTIHISLHQNQTKHILFQISNFITPPLLIYNQEQLKSLMTNLSQDQRIIAMFIPLDDIYLASKTPKSELDTYSGLHKVDLTQLQKQFIIKKYENRSNKNRFIIIRDEKLANQLKMNPNKPGSEYMYYKTNYNQGMQTSCLLFGQKFTIRSNPIPSPDKDILKIHPYSYINEINKQQDLQDFLRNMELGKQTRKILVIHCKQKRTELINQVKLITLKTAKMMKDKVIVLMTDNSKLLVDYFQIVPDSFVTIRLVDLNSKQVPLFQIPGFRRDVRRGFYGRSLLNGAFTVENLCKLISGKQPWKQYYEQKKLCQISSIVSKNEKIPNNTVLVYWKHGCKGCELTLNYLQAIQSQIQCLTPQIIYKYQIENPTLLKNTTFHKYNILNECDQREVDHDVTPKMMYFNNGQWRDLNIGEILSKVNVINVQNQKTVHQGIIKEIITAIQKAHSESVNKMI